MAKEFLISDESTNSYGFKVQTSGINLKQFKKNPIGYYNHDREAGVICRWENIRVDGTCLYATPVFDLNDPIGAKIAAKVEGGFIKAASIGAEQGVFRTIGGENILTSCDLCEVSVCDLPSNKNALALYVENKAITNKEEIVKLFVSQKDMKGDLKPIANTLGLNNEASVNEIVLAINTLKGANKPEAIIDEAIHMSLIAKYEKEELLELANANPLAFGKYLEKRKQKVLHERAEEGLKLINTAMRDGRLNCDAERKVEAFWLNSFKTDYEGSKIALENLPKRQSIRDTFTGLDPEGRENWTLSDYRKKAPKELKNNPSLYKELVERENQQQK